jgi:hypothetical protein
MLTGTSFFCSSLILRNIRNSSSRTPQLYLLTAFILPMKFLATLSSWKLEVGSFCMANVLLVAGCELDFRDISY